MARCWKGSSRQGELVIGSHKQAFVSYASPVHPLSFFWFVSSPRLNARRHSSISQLVPSTSLVSYEMPSSARRSDFKPSSLPLVVRHNALVRVGAVACIFKLKLISRETLQIQRPHTATATITLLPTCQHTLLQSNAAFRSHDEGIVCRLCRVRRLDVFLSS